MTGLAMSVSVKIKRGAKRVNLTTIRFTQQRHVLGNYSNNRNIKLIILIASIMIKCGGLEVMKQMD